jgi:hypothetical protein
MDQGAMSSQLVREQWRQKDASFDLAEPVSRLEELVARLKNPAA